MPSRQALCVIALLTAAYQVGVVFSVNSCGQTMTIATSAYLSSPSKNHNGGFTTSYVMQNGHYPKGLDCTYTISAPNGKAIRLAWKSFDVSGNMPDCKNGDYVEIFIGCSRYSIGKYCSSNSQRPFDIYSPDECMMLKFHSESNNKTGTGFQARYNTFSNIGRYRNYQCITSSYGALMTSSYGTFSSSYWPSFYTASYTSCYFKISVSSGKRTKIVFMDFELPVNYKCDKTKIKIKGGGSSYSSAYRTIMDSKCGFKKPFSVTTGESTIHVRFKSKSTSIKNRGFIAGYVTYNEEDDEDAKKSSAVIVGIIIAIIIIVIVVVVVFCFIKKRRERQRQAGANQAVSVPLAPAPTYPSQPPPPQQQYAPPPSYGQAAGYPYPSGQEKPPLGSYPSNQAPYPQQGYNVPPGPQHPYPPPGGQPYPPPGGQPYPPPGGQSYPPPGGQPYPPPGGDPYPPPGSQPYPPPGGAPPPGGPAPPYPT